MNLTTVSPELLDAAWSAVLPWIADACRRGSGDQTPADLLRLCRKSEGALILIGRPGEAPVAAGVTQIRDHDGGRRECWILALGGSGARAWRDTLGTIEANAQRIGCASVRFVGRPGWAALLPGYDCHASFEKVL